VQFIILALKNMLVLHKFLNAIQVAIKNFKHKIS